MVVRAGDGSRTRSVDDPPQGRLGQAGRRAPDAQAQDRDRRSGTTSFSARGSWSATDATSGIGRLRGELARGRRHVVHGRRPLGGAPLPRPDDDDAATSTTSASGPGRRREPRSLAGLRRPSGRSSRRTPATTLVRSGPWRTSANASWSKGTAIVREGGGRHDLTRTFTGRAHRLGRRRWARRAASARVVIDGVLRRDDQPAPPRPPLPAGRVREVVGGRGDAHDQDRGLGDERAPARGPRCADRDPLGDRKRPGGPACVRRLAAGWYGRAPGSTGRRREPPADDRLRQGRQADRGTLDVERGHPVRTGHDPDQALHRDRVRLRDPVQHAPRDGPLADPDEGLVPRGREGHLARRHGEGLRVRARPVRRDHGRGPREGPAQDRPVASRSSSSRPRTRRPASTRSSRSRRTTSSPTRSAARRSTSCARCSRTRSSRRSARS